jgi:hypothetical protein
MLRHDHVEGAGDVLCLFGFFSHLQNCKRGVRRPLVALKMTHDELGWSIVLGLLLNMSDSIMKK